MTVKMLLQNKNITFLQLPYSPEELIDAAQTIQGLNQKWLLITTLEGESVFRKTIEREIERFFHTFNHNEVCKPYYDAEGYKWCLKIFSLSPEQKPQTLIDFEDKLISLIQTQHSSFKNSTREEILKTAADYYLFEKQQLLPEGTKFTGVFVDRDDTLFDNDTKDFNPKVLDMIQTYQSENKQVTIRTLGNIEEKRKILKNKWLNLEIKNKADFKWGEVEIAIDNENSELFFANTLVKPQKFIQIKV